MQNFSQEGIDAFKAGNKVEATRLLTQAVRQNSADENAWLYLGFSLDTPTRKRQCFQRVLAINPANQQAKSALAALGEAGEASTAGASAAGGSTTGSASGTASGTTANSGSGFANPIHVEGAPAQLTVPYVIDTARRRIDQAIQIYTTRDMEAYYQMAQGATLWDSIFIAGIAGLSAAAAELVGRLIGFILGGFLARFGGIISPFFFAIGAFVGIAGGFAVGIWASHEYLKSQQISVSLSQHAIYYALIFLPFALVSAALSFIVNALGILAILVVCLSPLIVPALIAVGIYNLWLLKKAVQRAYTLPNDKAWITAAIAVVTSGVVSGVLRSVFGIVFH